jgi:(S)-mandelate dehydrogenase
MNIDDCINLDDLRNIAKRRVPKLIYDFIEGGVDDESGLARNEDAFSHRSLMPKYMAGNAPIDRSTTIFGKTYSSPFGISPMGGIGNYRRGGDLMLARAARNANIPFILSGAATAAMEDVAREAPDHGWYQLYTAKDRSIADDQVKRAADLGMPVLVVTVDVPVSPNRERNRRNGFGRPLKLTLATKLNALTKPAWMLDYLQHGIAMLPNWQAYAPPGTDAPGVAEFVASQLPNSIEWKDIERIRKLWPRALVLKGVIRADEAERAAALGVDGLIVSNHGARQLDRAPASLDALGPIDAAVGDKMTLMLDGGIRRGSDVVTALASGAKFIFMGRPMLYGAVAGGDKGASKAVAIVEDEMNKIMSQVGCRNIADIGPDLIWDQNQQNRNRV